MKRLPLRVARFVAVSLLAACLPLAMTHPARAARTKSITITDASVIEGDAGSKALAFTVKWTGAKGGAAPSVSYVTADGTAAAGSDYTAKTGSVTLSNGTCHCATISIPVLGDTLAEDTESFTVNLSSASTGTIADPQAIGTIYDNEGPPSLVVTDLSANEASGALGFQVLLTTASASTVTVAYATADGTATAGADYAAGGTTLTFTPGQTTKIVNVSVTDDALSEADETVMLNLTNASVAVADPQGVGTIVDDDPDPNVSIGDASIGEGDAGTSVVSFTVTLATPSGQETSVDYSTADGTATAGNDYEPANGTLTIPAGQLTAAFDVTVDGDLVHEGDETFTATIANPAGLTVVTADATATITDDDPAPTVAASDVAVGESAGTATVTFALSNPSVADVSFDWATADGTATAGVDYTAGGGTIVVPAGQVSATADIAILADTTHEPSETVAIVLSNPVNGSVGSGATVTITDDDPAITTLALKVAKTARTVKAKGILEPATPGLAVTVTLAKKQGTKYVKVATKTVALKGLKDRDGDGLIDGQYVAAFTRPSKGGYRFTATFTGTPDLRKSAKTARFRI